MKVAALLEKYELSGAQLGQQLGYTGAEAVNSRRRNDADVPEHWLPRLAELGYEVDGYTPTEERQYRDHDQTPAAQPGAPQAPITTKLDYASIAGHIEAIYKLSAEMVFKPADPILAEVLNDHAAKAGTAWAHWIESEPRVAAFIQKLMIGTPLGEVIGVHIAIVFTYTIARSAARDAIAEADRRRDGAAAGTEPGPDEDFEPSEVGPEDFVGAT